MKKNHLFEHIITSAMGVVSFVFMGLYIWYNLKTMNFQNFIVSFGFLVLGIMLLKSKDSWVKKIFDFFLGRLGGQNNVK